MPMQYGSENDATSTFRQKSPVLPPTQANPASSASLTPSASTGGISRPGGFSPQPGGAGSTDTSSTGGSSISPIPNGLNWSDLATKATENWKAGLPAIMQNTANATANATRAAEEGSAAMGRGFGGSYASMLAQQNVLGQQAQNQAISDWQKQGTNLFANEGQQSLGLYETGLNNQVPTNSKTVGDAGGPPSADFAGGAPRPGSKGPTTYAQVTGTGTRPDGSVKLDDGDSVNFGQIRVNGDNVFVNGQTIPVPHKNMSSSWATFKSVMGPSLSDFENKVPNAPNIEAAIVSYFAASGKHMTGAVVKDILYDMGYQYNAPSAPGV